MSCSGETGGTGSAVPDSHRHDNPVGYDWTVCAVLRVSAGHGGRRLAVTRTGPVTGASTPTGKHPLPLTHRPNRRTHLEQEERTDLAKGGGGDQQAGRQRLPPLRTARFDQRRPRAATFCTAGLPPAKSCNGAPICGTAAGGAAQNGGGQSRGVSPPSSADASCSCFCRFPSFGVTFSAATKPTVTSFCRDLDSQPSIGNSAPFSR